MHYFVPMRPFRASTVWIYDLFPVHSLPFSDLLAAIGAQLSGPRGAALEAPRLPKLCRQILLFLWLGWHESKIHEDPAVIVR